MGRKESMICGIKESRARELFELMLAELSAAKKPLTIESAVSYIMEADWTLGEKIAVTVGTCMSSTPPEG